MQIKIMLLHLLVDHMLLDGFTISVLSQRDKCNSYLIMQGRAVFFKWGDVIGKISREPLQDHILQYCTVSEMMDANFMKQM